MKTKIILKAKYFLRKLKTIFFQKQFNLEVCSDNGVWNQWNQHFKEAETAMDGQWDDIIFPIIKDFSFKTVLELAPGAGRNTEKLANLSETIYAVDLNKHAIEQLQRRFQDYSGNCKLFFYKNDGSRLKMIQSDSITLIYCWDSAVHFDKKILKDYIKEFSRTLKVGGKGFIHHSNLGLSAKVNISENPKGRSNMSKELFRRYCERVGLKVINQIDLPWGDTAGEEIVDCISIFQK